MVFNLAAVSRAFLASAQRFSPRPFSTSVQRDLQAAFGFRTQVRAGLARARRKQSRLLRGKFLPDFERRIVLALCRQSVGFFRKPLRGGGRGLVAAFGDCRDGLLGLAFPFGASRRSANLLKLGAGPRKMLRILLPEILRRNIEPLRVLAGCGGFLGAAGVEGSAGAEPGPPLRPCCSQWRLRLTSR